MDDFKSGVRLVVALLILLVLVFACIATYGNHQTFDAVVADKYVKRANENDVFYVVLDTDDGRMVCKNMDYMLGGKFNSADVQASLEIGDTYRVETLGHRIPFFSIFPNILSVERMEVDRESQEE